MNIRNPYASFTIEIPKQYQDMVKKYSRSSDSKTSAEYAPFERQVDIWFLAFLIAVNCGLEPVREEGEIYGAVRGDILDRDPYRISLIQICALGKTKNIEILKNPRDSFNYALHMANAGFPKLFQILRDETDTPLYSLFDELERMTEQAES